MSTVQITHLLKLFGDRIKDAEDDGDVVEVVGDLLKEFVKMSSVNNSTKKANKSKVKKKRKKSAYNIFVKEMSKSEEIKELPNKDRFCALGKMWKSYDEEEKGTWQGKADTINHEEVEVVVVVVEDSDLEEEVVVVDKKKRGKSGYNVFVQNISKSKEIQEVSGKERFQELGKMWKTYGEEDKEKWKEQAKLINSGDMESLAEGLERTEEGNIKME